MTSRAPVVFLQGFGRRDLFTGMPPEALWGWRRNVGLLVALLDRHGVAWEERYAPDLSSIRVDAGLVILRDWRYPADEVVAFCARHSGTPIIAMLFQCPQAFLDAQRRGLEHALNTKIGGRPEPIAAGAEDGLFATEHVIVRSPLNAELFERLGYARDKMVLMPHAPLWTLANGDIRALELPAERRRCAQGDGLEVLFVGESLWRKGLVHLYRAFGCLQAAGKRLHVYNTYLNDPAGGLGQFAPDSELRQALETMLRDPAVTVHAPYRGVAGLIEAHRDADLLACPALLDCGPNVLVEAYQLGTPILASDLCGAARDMPAGALHIVPAPRWWEAAEPAAAYETRLAAALDVHIDRLVREAPPFAALQAMLDATVDTWQRLLETYGILTPAGV